MLIHRYRISAIVDVSSWTPGSKSTSALFFIILHNKALVFILLIFSFVNDCKSNMKMIIFECKVDNVLQPYKHAGTTKFIYSENTKHRQPTTNIHNVAISRDLKKSAWLRKLSQCGLHRPQYCQTWAIGSVDFENWTLLTSGSLHKLPSDLNVDATDIEINYMKWNDYKGQLRIVSSHQGMQTYTIFSQTIHQERKLVSNQFCHWNITIYSEKDSISPNYFENMLHLTNTRAIESSGHTNPRALVAYRKCFLCEATGDKMHLLLNC